MAIPDPMPSAAQVGSFRRLTTTPPVPFNGCRSWTCCRGYIPGVLRLTSTPRERQVEGL